MKSTVRWMAIVATALFLAGSATARPKRNETSESSSQKMHLYKQGDSRVDHKGDRIPISHEEAKNLLVTGGRVRVHEKEGKQEYYLAEIKKVKNDGIVIFRQKDDNWSFYEGFVHANKIKQIEDLDVFFGWSDD